jgi:integrase
MSARPYAVTAYRDLTPDVQRAVTPLWNLPPRHGTAAQVAEATRTDAAKVSTVQRHHPAWLDAPAAGRPRRIPAPARRRLPLRPVIGTGNHGPARLLYRSPVGELAGLHGHRIDWRRGRLFVVEIKTKSGIKEYPKSSRSPREVPTPEHVLEALARHMLGRERDGVVFTTVTKGRSGRLLDDGNWRKYTWWPAVKAAEFHDVDGVLRPVPLYPPHSPRHTCASWLVQNGVSLYEPGADRLMRSRA